MLDDLVDALDSGKDDDEILPLITEEAAQSQDPDGCKRTTASRLERECRWLVLRRLGV